MNPSRLVDLARALAAREMGRREARDAALDLAERLRAEVEEAIHRFAAAAADAGAPHLGHLLHVSPVRPDDKSIRAFQFVVTRGRWEGIVVSKDRGEVMLVGPFRRFQEQGPCRPVQLKDERLDRPALETALEEFLLSLIDQSCQG